MHKKIKSLFDKKNNDEIQSKYEEISNQNKQLLSRLLAENKEFIKKYNL